MVPTPQPGNKLHADGRLRIHALQVPNQLCQIFNRVDVVVRRRRNQLHARLCVTQPRDQFCDLVARQLSTLTGLRALRNFDLQFLGMGQIFGGHAKARAGDLFDFVVQQRRSTI